MSLKKITSLYIDGFKNMGRLGKKLWLIILIKLFIMFAILKLFFFKDFLSTKFSSEEEKSNYVIEVITTNKNPEK